MTPVRVPAPSEAAHWSRAQALATAVLGLALLLGTAAGRLAQTGAPFPDVKTAEAETRAAPVRGPASRQAVGVPAPAATRPVAAGVDINRADSLALQQLPGIGPVLAERIVAYREAHGRFGSVDDLREVSGIGPKRFERIQPLIRIGDGP